MAVMNINVIWGNRVVVILWIVQFCAHIDNSREQYIKGFGRFEPCLFLFYFFIYTTVGYIFLFANRAKAK